jgi:hypothetical protein
MIEYWSFIRILLMLFNIGKPFCNFEFLLLLAQSISGLDVGFFWQWSWILQSEIQNFPPWYDFQRFLLRLESQYDYIFWCPKSRNDVLTFTKWKPTFEVTLTQKVFVPPQVSGLRIQSHIWLFPVIFPVIRLFPVRITAKMIWIRS